MIILIPYTGPGLNLEYMWGRGGATPLPDTGPKVEERSKKFKNCQGG